MSRIAGSSRWLNLRSSSISDAPRRLIYVILAVESVALIWFIGAFVLAPPRLSSVAIAGLLAGIAVAFEELVARASRLQLRLSAELKRDMTSVWAVAGAAALSPTAAALLLLIVYSHIWLRQQRPAGEVFYRKAFNFANTVTSCAAAAYVIRGLRPALDHLPTALSDLAAVTVVIVSFGIVNRLLATAGLFGMGLPLKHALGSRDDNLIEIATLCLGGLVAVTAVFQPLLAVLVVAPMVTMQRGAVMRELEAAATTDAKTGLLNAVAWDEVASRELQRSAREGKEVAVLIIDIDHFKLVNDVHGHLAGDQVLKRLARTLSAAVREYDTVARFGGEEFVAVLPSTSAAEAFAIAERIRTSLYELRVSAVVENVDPALDQRIAVSIGLAIAPTDGVELPDLLHMADSALYRAKAEGRNRVVAAGEGPGRTAQVLPFV